MTPSLTYWINGEFVSADEATISMRDVGLLRGYGVFDYLRTYGLKPFRLIEHIRRLQSSADQIGLALPLDLEEIADLTERLIAKNGLPNVGVRFVATGGISENGFTPAEKGSLAILIEPLNRFSTDVYAQGAKLVTSRLQREFPTVKSTNYIGAIMAMKLAKEAGAVEALYVDAADEISECTRSNFFVVQDGALRTAEKNVLPGITRQVILEFAPEILPVEICPLLIDQLSQVQEAFISSSTKEILPITQIDDLMIGDGAVGPMTKALAKRFKREI